MTATMTQSRSDSNPFIKQLASSDRSIRDKALSALRTYLSRSTAFTPLDLLKIWKALHYCMFMSDKPRNQQRLARDLADLTDVLHGQNQMLWLEAFWKTMAREWAGIDSLRVDKYLYLIRCYVNKGFEVCGKQGWKEEVVNEYLEVLSAEGGPLSSRDVKVPAGLKLHVLDIWVDELEKVDGDRKADVGKIMAPIRQLQAETAVKSVRVRAKEALTDERLVDGKSWREEQQGEEGGETTNGFGGFED